jgi:hypothetical protein
MAAKSRGDYGVHRLFVGSRDRMAMVQIKDTKGQVRIQLYVDNNNIARLEFLDESGKKIASYPPQE